ncbi:hypothetical protein FQN57_003533 [Myotisia sp. PD_48]|nr:hypothetical protein FQN57_003533 [Myotisia sp. PD_48]
MSDAFASLTPANALAKLAFSDVYNDFLSRRQSSQPDFAQATLDRMQVEPEQVCDKEIIRLQCEIQRSKYDTDAEASDTLTELDTDTEEQFRELGMVWVGCYLLKLEPLPVNPERGWTAGKGPLENLPMELLLCTTSFAKSHKINLRNPHARFNFFPESKGFYIIGCSRSPSAQLMVNGDAATRRPYHLNQYSMKILFDKLEYHFQWTEFAASDHFKERRGNYVATYFNGPTIADFEMPTPLPNKRTIGRWTLGGALGAGAQGRVFFASDQSANVAAVKVVERTPRNCHSVDNEIKILQEVTKLAQKSSDDERIVCMTEAIYSIGEEFCSKMAFDNIAIVLKPMTPRTLVDLFKTPKQDCKGMTIEAANAFRSTLLGVKIMHDGGWMHRDLKPANVGLIGSEARSVLLDIGTARHIQADESLPPEPGTVGTIGYLAPELELDSYNHSIDIWSMGVILFELTYNYHPWRFAINPWRDGKDNEKLRPSFQKSYEAAIDKMASDYKSARVSPISGYIHLGGLFIDMVRHQRATKNCARRPDIGEVLQHPAWGALLPETSPSKRPRLDVTGGQLMERLNLYIQTLMPTASQLTTALWKTTAGRDGNVEQPSYYNGERISVHCPLANKSMNSQDWLDDVVATQGSYLFPRKGTPVWEKAYDEQFAAQLQLRLYGLYYRQTCRRAIYHNAADEWPIGRTPPEIKEKRNAELEALDALWDITSEDSNVDNDDNKSGTSVDTTVNLEKPVAEVVADCLPTPPLSAEIPLVTPHRRKRRRVSMEDHEDRVKEHPSQKQASFSENSSISVPDSVPKMARQRGQKRRHTSEKSNKVDEDKKQFSKK